jgi:aminoglycoside phosphotransferase (APT) family kinase protein
VLRKKPPGQLLKSAHAVDREYRVMKGLENTDVPVPRMLLLCEDDTVIGTAFFVMEFVDGTVFWNPALPELTKAQRAKVYDEQNRALAALHSVDPAKVGLADFGKAGSYFARQRDRWTKQYRASETEHLADMERLIAWLEKNEPPDDGRVSLVHGDYRLDNMILAPSGEVAAVVDWELCTLGDPLADVGMLLVYWSEQGDEFTPLFEAATMAAGFPGREEVKARYAERSGRDLSGIDYYVALGYWKLAIVLEGVFARYAAGQYGETDEGFQEFAKVVEQLAEAADTAERLR